MKLSDIAAVLTIIVAIIAISAFLAGVWSPPDQESTPTPTPSLSPTPTPTPTITTSIPIPKLVLSGTESYTAGGKQWVRYRLSIENWATFPAELFEPAPDLPPCGLNQNASRTWVEIYDAKGDKYIYGFCALSSPKALTSIWFAVEQGISPPNAVYVLLKDRRHGATYRSNEVSPSP